MNEPGIAIWKSHKLAKLSSPSFQSILSDGVTAWQIPGPPLRQASSPHRTPRPQSHKGALPTHTPQGTVPGLSNYGILPTHTQRHGTPSARPQYGITQIHSKRHNLFNTSTLLGPPPQHTHESDGRPKPTHRKVISVREALHRLSSSFSSSNSYGCVYEDVNTLKRSMIHTN